MKPFYHRQISRHQFRSSKHSWTPPIIVPPNALNFLKDWKDGNYPQGWDKKPVTWVSQEDARAYAAWAGKRLPHEWEWQLAAQGIERRIYPWGNDVGCLSRACTRPCAHA